MSTKTKRAYKARPTGHKRPLLTPDSLNKLTAAFRAAAADLEAGTLEKAVTISAGNRKMGEIASVSLLPVLTCPGECKTTCGRYCYALKTALFRTSVMKSYAKNTVLALRDPESYWVQVEAAIKRSRFFRFHVSGDAPNMAYLERMITTAAQNPHCEILAFTKRHVWFNLWVAEHGGSIAEAIPANLHVLFSGEKNLKPVNPYHFPETVVIGKDEEIPENVTMCGGSCEHCFCGGLGCIRARQGETIGFIEH